MRDWLKRLIAKEELEALHRYREACLEIETMCRPLPEIASVAKHIQACGDNCPRVPTSLFCFNLYRKKK